VREKKECQEGQAVIQMLSWSRSEFSGSPLEVVVVSSSVLVPVQCPCSRRTEAPRNNLRPLKAVGANR
jgi:hypothetical protein